MTSRGGVAGPAEPVPWMDNEISQAGHGRLGASLVPERHWNTPGPVGYAVAAIVAVAIFASGLGLIVGFGSSGSIITRAQAGAVTGMVAGFFAGIVAVVAGIPLTVLVHFLVRKVRRQLIHVAAFGVLGAVVGLGLALAFWYRDSAGVQLLVWPVAVGGCTALGRLSVIRWIRGPQAAKK